ncbi:hypothetical protein IFM47457_09796 [Aspergillus lentulus]|nr:hypothetical protein IFM47457_09796 [Aspergillus lentulus]
MHLSPWATATFITAATAATLKVNYYSDGGCSNYMTSLNPTTDFYCYDYVWSGSNSVNIADCTFPNGKCLCTFYTQPHCVGGRLWGRAVRARENECGFGFSWQGEEAESWTWY